jgi:hypothetical protein
MNNSSSSSSSSFSSIQKAKPTKISKYFEVSSNEGGGGGSSFFNTLNVQLNTKFDPENHCTSYELLIKNYDKLNITTGLTTTTAATEEEADLMVLQEALKYLIYHPFLSRKINKYDVTIHTTSKYLANSNFNDDTKIRSMISCIRSVSIILQ